MDLTDILTNAEDQERGRWFELRNPVDGEPTGIRLRIAGPDSQTQARSRLRLVDELAEAAGEDGRVKAEARDTARRNSLARCILDWEVTEGGHHLPFNHKNILRLLGAAPWVEAQVDFYAADRRAFMAPIGD